MEPKEDTYNPKKQIRPLVTTLLVLFGLGILSSFLLEGIIRDLADTMFARFGTWGIVIGTMITDTSPFPLPAEPVALIGLGANVPLWKVILIMSGTSHVAGLIGYGCGRSLGKIPGLKQKFEARYPKIFLFMQKHGVKGVAIAAITPIPYALTNWAAGVAGVSFKGVFLACSLRWIKTPLYVLLFAGGWTLGM
jgi:membrane protein YqaA with SNARE-associated domain